MGTQARPPRPTRAERRAATHATLIDTAARAFARKGYRGASVDEIAAEAGFTTGALYAHFANKRELFAAVFARHCEQQLAALDELGRPVADLAELCERLLAPDRDDELWWLLWLEYQIDAARNPADAFALVDIERQGRRVIEAAVRGYLPEGVDDGTVATLAIAIQALWRGWLLARNADPSGASTGELADALRWLVGGAVRAAAPTTASAAPRTPT